MIVNLFRQTQTISILSILILCILIWMGFSFQENPQIISGISPFFDAVISPILQEPIINRLSLGTLVFWQCVLVNRVMVKQKVFSTNTLFPCLFYFLTLSISPKAIFVSPSLFALTLIMFSLNKIMDTYLDKSAYSKVFDSSILMSLSILIHPPFLFLTPIIWIGISIFSQLEWRYWIISILGLICPLFILYSLNQYFSIQEFDLSFLFRFLNEKKPLFALEKGDLLTLIAFGLISILALIELIISLKRKNIKARKSYILLLWLLLLSVVYTIVSPDHFHVKLLALALPVSIILSNYFYYNKNSKWLNLIFIILLISLFLNHFIW